MTFVAYEAGFTVLAFGQHLAVEDVIAEMPLFLEGGAHVSVPLEETYQRAYAEVPRRWRQVVESSSESERENG